MTGETIFAAALQKGPAERAAFVAQACGEDSALRREVEELLRVHDEAGGFLQGPALTSAYTPAGPFPAEGPGTRIGRYKLLQVIGEGGMGVVYLAEQSEPVRRHVALKVLKPGMGSGQVLARFEAERQALALMDHPNIAKVLDAGTTEGGRPYFVMELVKGVPITRFCDEHRLTPQQRLELFVPVCRAVQHAHTKGVIHRDLKPGNVLVALYDDRPVPKVIDFGIAKAVGEPLTERTLFTEFGSVVGTLEYMSPEQAKLNALDVDTRSDVYSLGVLLYELLTGTTPLDRARLRQSALDELLRLIREEEPPLPSTRLSSSGLLPSLAAQRGSEPHKLGRVVRGELDWIVMKALEKDRNRRYETANALARDVERFLHDEPVEASPPLAGYRLRKFLKKHRRAVGGAALLFLALLLGVARTSLDLVRARQAQAAEQEQRRQAVAQQQAAQENERKARASEAETRAVLDFLAAAVNGSAISMNTLAAQPRNVTVREALTEAEKCIGPTFRNQPGTEARVRFVVGESLMYQGDEKLAAEQFERALELWRRLLGPGHPDTLKAMVRLALCRADLGQASRATELADEVLTQVRVRQRERGHGPQEDRLLLELLAIVYEEAGAFTKALPLHREMVAQDRSDDAVVGLPDSLFALGGTLLHAGKPAEAEPVLRECLGIYETEWPNDWFRHAVEADLGSCLLRQKKYADAEPLLMRAYEGLKRREEDGPKKRTLDHGALLDWPRSRADRVRETAEQLVQLYEATGQKVKAEQWRAQLPRGKKP